MSEEKNKKKTTEENKITYKNYQCDDAPEGHCVKGCWTNDRPLCDFDECPYEKGKKEG